MPIFSDACCNATNNINMEEMHKYFIEKNTPIPMTKRLTGISVDDEKDIVDRVADFMELKGISIVGERIMGALALRYLKRKP